MGIGTLGLVDADTVDLSNLHRQILHTEARVGQSKVASAVQALKARNSQIRYIGYERDFVADGAVGIVEGRGPNGEILVDGGYDIVLDCTDNPATRYLISDVCVLTGRPLISGAAQKAEGQLMRLCYPPPPPPRDKQSSAEPHTRGPCYRCVFPNPPPPETVQSCAEIGILGPVVGLIGTLMAMEVMKILIANPNPNSAPPDTQNQTQTQTQNQPYTPTLLLYNALSPSPLDSFRSVRLRRTARADCLVCGTASSSSSSSDRGAVSGRGPQITRAAIENGDVDYVGWCGRVEELDVVSEGERVTAEGFVRVMKTATAVGKGKREGNMSPDDAPVVVVDVREDIEVQMGTKIAGAVYLPISKILRSGAGGAEGQLETRKRAGAEGGSMLSDIVDPDARKVFFVCQRGNDSQIAARRLIDEVRAGRTGTGEGEGEKEGTDEGVWIGDVIGGFEALEKISLR